MLFFFFSRRNMTWDGKKKKSRADTRIIQSQKRPRMSIKARDNQPNVSTVSHLNLYTSLMDVYETLIRSLPPDIHPLDMKFNIESPKFAAVKRVVEKKFKNRDRIVSSLNLKTEPPNWSEKEKWKFYREKTTMGKFSRIWIWFRIPQLYSRCWTFWGVVAQFSE